jgi:protein-S-isoprenylcysteine O-methyltransferase Ste14
MNSFLRATQLVLVLTLAIALLIVVPAAIMGIAREWKVIFLALSYLCFFLGTVWRVLRYGELTRVDEDEQIKETSGQLASFIALVGLWGIHWLAVYDFSITHRATARMIDWVWEVVAIALISAAIIIYYVTISTLGKFFDRLTIKPDHQLVRQGIYNIIRHPIYTSYILLFAGYCTLFQSFLALALLAGVCIIWFGNRIAIEEDMLLGRFGDEYRQYCQETKRLFPYIL